MTDDDADFRSPKKTLLTRGLRPRVRFGQHFLVDPRFAARVAEELPEGAFVIEIGGGTGTLTQALARRARLTEVLEIDRGLCGVLHERFADQSDRVRVIGADALAFDFGASLAAQSPPRAVCGNLPYNITTPLLERIVACADSWESAVVMVQHEYGRRLAARPRSADYGSLTIFVRHFCDVERLFEVGAAGFYPAPKIASMVVRLTPNRSRRGEVMDEPLLLWLIRAAFAQRRKLLANSLASALANNRGRASGERDGRLLVDAAVRQASLPQTARAEELTYEDFRRLANAMHAVGFIAPLGYHKAPP